MLAHFQLLLDDLPKIRQQVEMLKSPIPDDDRMVRFAILGYSYSQPTETWGRDEFDFVASRRLEVQEFGPLWVEFVCLASGYLLGLYKAAKCNDREFALFEAQLPGFMWLNSEQFTAPKDNEGTD